MTWPYDARLKTFTALTPIQSSFLNNVQDQIIRVFELKEHVFNNGQSEPIGGAPSWEYGGFGWGAAIAGGYLIIPIELPELATWTKWTTKFFLKDGAGDLTATMKKAEVYPADPDDPVGASSTIGAAQTLVRTLGSDDWGEAGQTFVSEETIDKDFAYLLEIDGTNSIVGDGIYGVKIQYYMFKEDL